MKYQVLISDAAKAMIAKVSDRRIRELILRKIEELSDEPDKKGKALLGELRDFRSIRAVGQRYRIIYRVDHHQIIVMVVGAGIRKDGGREDIYHIFKKMVHLKIIK